MEEKLPISYTILKLLRIAITNEAMCPECGKDLQICNAKDKNGNIEPYIQSLCDRCGYSCDKELDDIDTLIEEYGGD